MAVCVKGHDLVIPLSDRECLWKQGWTARQHMDGGYLGVNLWLEGMMDMVADKCAAKVLLPMDVVALEHRLNSAFAGTILDHGFVELGEHSLKICSLNKIGNKTIHSDYKEIILRIALF